MKKVILFVLICIGCALLSDSPIHFIKQEEIVASQVDVPLFDYKQFVYLDDDIDESKLHVYFELDQHLYQQEQGMNVVVNYKGRKFMKRYEVLLVDTMEPEIITAEDFRIGVNMTGLVEDYITITDQKGVRVIPHQSESTAESGYYIIKQNGVDIVESFDTSEIGTQLLEIYVDDGRGKIIQEEIEFEVVDFDDFYISGEEYLEQTEGSE